MLLRTLAVAGISVCYSLGAAAHPRDHANAGDMFIAVHHAVTPLAIVIVIAAGLVIAHSWRHRAIKKVIDSRDLERSRD